MATSAPSTNSHPLFAQTLGKAARATDPNLQGPAGSTPQPTPAPMTTGNNRVTIRVPAQATKLSLGQGDATETATRNKRPGIGTESGIVGQTDAHIHFETFGTDNKLAKTLVRLGIPPTSVPAGGYSAGASTGIGLMFPEAYSVWNGYSMVTQGAAYQEAYQNHLIASATGEVRVVGKTMISLASAGGVVIGADPGPPPKTLIQNQGGPDEPGAFGDADKYFRIQQITNVVTRTSNVVSTFLSAVAEIVAAFGKAEPMVGEPGWEPDAWYLQTSTILKSVFEMGDGIAGVVAASLAPSSPSGNVAIFAAKDLVAAATEELSINAGGVASMYAGAAASVVSPLTSVIGTVSASVQGVWASLSGLWGARVEATLRDAVLRSQLGNVQVFATTGNVTATGTKNVQLNSVLGGAFVHGLTSAYLGSGIGEGWGVQVTPLRATFGQMIMPEVFAAPGFLSVFGVSVSDVMLTVSHTASNTTWSPLGIENVSDITVTTTAPMVVTTAEAVISMEAPLILVAGEEVFLG